MVLSGWECVKRMYILKQHKRWSYYWNNKSFYKVFFLTKRLPLKLLYVRNKDHKII